MVIESRLSKADFIKINLHMAFRRRSRYITVAATIVLTAVALLSGNYVLLLVWLYFAFVVTPVFYRTLRAAFSRKNASFFLPVRRTFSEKGVQTESPISNALVPWNQFVQWKKLPNYYLLYINPRSFVGIPRSAVPDADAFESLLRRKIRQK